MGWRQDFTQFIAKGNVIDMAVGVVIGLYFGMIVQALVAGLILPLISVGGTVNFSSWTYTIGHGVFEPGLVLTTLITFLLVALVVFFAIVRPVGAMRARQAAKAGPPSPSTKECPECLSQVPLKARRCMYCTSVIGAA